ncbi:MAG: hypothetical protein QXW24_02925 [Ignisphaera sp.]
MSTPAGIFDSFAKLIRITSREDKQKGVFIYLSSSINELKLRLEEVKRRLKERDDELLANAVKALSYNDRERAAIYASEIVEVRKLVKFVNIALLAIERVLERLRTMDIVNDMKTLSTALGILNELKNMFTHTMPELASMLDTIVSNTNSLVSSTQAPEPSVNIFIKTKEVEEIMKEAESKAEENMRSSLQPLPIQLKNMIDSVNREVVNRIQREEKFIIDRSSIPTAIPTSYYNHNAGNNLEMRIYHYILNKNGALDINECVKIFGITKDEVIKILKRLEEKGLIRIT